MDDENEKKSNKSKTVFKTSCCALSKLAEQAKIRLFYDFQVYNNLNL